MGERETETDRRTEIKNDKKRQVQREPHTETTAKRPWKSGVRESNGAEGRAWGEK